MIYFDATFLVKLHLEEPGSERVLEFVRQRNEVVASSLMAKMETVAAFHRKYREGSINQASLRSAHGQLSREVETGRLEWLPLSIGIVDRVHNAFLNLPANVFLRTGDAIHLATAAEAGFKEIYSNDRHLLAAATLFKLKGINPLAK
jgi:predicted nucleic acid-binding protein